jgi:hypothetical protein
VNIYTLQTPKAAHLTGFLNIYAKDPPARQAAGVLTALKMRSVSRREVAVRSEAPRTGQALAGPYWCNMGAFTSAVRRPVCAVKTAWEPQFPEFSRGENSEKSNCCAV